MGDEFEQYKVSAQPSTDEFAQYKVPTTPNVSSATPPTPDNNLQLPHGLLELHTLGREVISLGKSVGSAAGTIYHQATDPITPEEKMAPEFKNYPNPSQATLALYRMVHPIDVAANWYDQASSGKVPNAFEQALTVAPEAMGIGASAPVTQKLAGMAAPAAIKAIKAAAGASANKAAPVTAESSAPTIGSIMARKIPIVGRVLRNMDDINDLKTAIQNKLSGTAQQPAPEPAATPTDQPQVVPLKLPQAKAGDPYASPRTPVMEPAQSTTIEQHGYHANSQTLVVQFKNGNVYEYRGVPPEVYNAYKNSESQGSFFANNIKGRYQTNLRGRVPPTAGSRVRQALGGQPSNTPLK